MAFGVFTENSTMCVRGGARDHYCEGADLVNCSRLQVRRRAQLLQQRALLWTLQGNLDHWPVFGVGP